MQISTITRRNINDGTTYEEKFLEVYVDEVPGTYSIPLEDLAEALLPYLVELLYPKAT